MAGKEQAKELNERFAEWYYVVPSESVAKLKLARTDLVKPKKSDPPLEAPVSPGEQNLPPTPDINFPPKDQSDSDNPDNANKTTEKKSSDPKDKPSTNEQKKVDKSEQKSEDKSNK